MTATPDVDTLAEQRRRSRRFVQQFTYLADNYVDQALVKTALLQGLSQSETAKALGMSKKTVNTHARRPWVPTAAAKGLELPDATPFYRYIWGSDDAAAAAIATCKRYDRERLHIETY
ncbi:MAG: sigma factor-like helix-turn-helix DNA-binding protein [Rhodococcus sp. (in: high G+C Gram-positive bacteria)]|uniref:sigma factor-like helix-turn-helix DNA-binding protein n=1 Tax=Rhodococcus sp. KRD197 TaxID=2729731 RepID=UPI0019D1BC39|nr:sigma factor-like helix-turn-helix DNA-binding protein [Rhodococcus sp. KRD197]